MRMRWGAGLAAFVLVLSGGLPSAVGDVAADGGIVLVQGVMRMCAQTVKAAHPAAGCGGQKQNGLYLAGQPGEPEGPFGLRTGPLVTRKWVQRTGNWQLESGQVLPGPACAALVVRQAAAKGCSILLAGQLSPVAGLGAACGLSSGHSGAGILAYDNGTAYDLSGVGWVLSAGATLPVTGTYDLSAAGAGKPSKGAGDAKRVGPLAGLLQLAADWPCVASSTPPPVARETRPGVSVFTFFGVIKMF